MRFVLICAALALSSTGALAATTVVANYQGDFTASTPSAGWSYLWNPLNTTLGNSASY